MLKKLKRFLDFSSTDQTIAQIKRSINLHQAEVEDLEKELRHYENLKRRKKNHEQHLSKISL